MIRARKVMAAKNKPLPPPSMSSASASSSSSSSSAAAVEEVYLTEQDLATTAASTADDDARVKMDESTNDTWMLQAFYQWWLVNCHYDFYLEHCVLWSDWGGERKELSELENDSKTRYPKLVCMGDNVWFVHHQRTFFYAMCKGRVMISAVALWLKFVLRDFDGKHIKGKSIPNIHLLVDVEPKSKSVVSHVQQQKT